MNICALVPTWRRRKITIETIRQILDQTTPPDKIIVVGSCYEDRMVSNITGVGYLEVPNEPLGAKVQAGIEYCRRFNPDGLLLCGSDDWLSSNWIEVLSPYLEDYDLVGCNTLYIMHCSKRHPFQIGRCSYEGTKREREPMGPGRFLSRRILDKINWKVYPSHIRNNLDGNSFKILLDNGCKIWLETGDKVKILSPKGDWDTINSWDNIVLYDRIKEIIKNPKQWLEDNFSDVLEKLHRMDIHFQWIKVGDGLKLKFLPARQINQ